MVGKRFQILIQSSRIWFYYYFCYLFESRCSWGLFIGDVFEMRVSQIVCDILTVRSGFWFVSLPWHLFFFFFLDFDLLRQCLESEDDLQQLQSDGVPAEVTDWLASTFTRRVRRPTRRSDEKPKFRSIVHAVQAGIFVERWKGTFISFLFAGLSPSPVTITAAAVKTEPITSIYDT